MKINNLFLFTILTSLSIIICYDIKCKYMSSVYEPSDCFNLGFTEFNIFFGEKNFFCDIFFGEGDLSSFLSVIGSLYFLSGFIFSGISNKF